METLGKLGSLLEAFCGREDLKPKELSHPRERIRVVPFKDNKGYVQVITRSDDMLDVEMLNVELQRELRPLTLKRQRDVRNRFGTDVNVPIPVSHGGWETVIDLRVLELEFLEIPVSDTMASTVPLDALLKLYKEPHKFEVIKRVGDNPSGGGDVDKCIRDFTSMKIQRRLDKTIELPPLSSSARRLMELRTDPNANLNDLVKIIEMDASLTASILRWAGSSFYTHAGEVFSIKDAIGRVMGFDLVLNLAMGLTLGGSIGKPKIHPDGFMDYWHQSVWMAYGCATICGTIPARDRPSYGMVYLTGLLHNFGYLVLNHTFPPYFEIACRHWEANRHLDTNYVEMSLLGITREKIASELFKCWEMPDELVVSIREQKTPGYDGPYHKYVDILKASRCLLNELGFPAGVHVDSAEPYLERLKVDRDLLSERMELLLAKRKQIDNMASLL
jgi:HD-like signal output (HDOD) protein